MALDTSVGMVFSDVIAFFIILTTAAVLHASGVTNIRSAAEAAEALRPLCPGDLTFVLFALGSPARGCLRSQCLPARLRIALPRRSAGPRRSRRKRRVGFYSIIAAATVMGLALGYTPIDPIQMPIWSAVLNGIVAVPIMTVMWVVVTRLSVMGRFSARPTLTFFGWAGTALMAVTVDALFWSSIG